VFYKPKEKKKKTRKPKIINFEAINHRSARNAASKKRNS
jgi:hypothetical protein